MFIKTWKSTEKSNALPKTALNTKQSGAVDST